MTRIWKEVVEAIETAGASKNGKKSEDEYPENLIWVPYIRYLITFWKKSVSMSLLFDSSSKVNAIYPTFTKELGLFIRPKDIKV